MPSQPKPGLGGQVAWALEMSVGVRNQLCVSARAPVGLEGWTPPAPPPSCRTERPCGLDERKEKLGATPCFSCRACYTPGKITPG